MRNPCLSLLHLPFVVLAATIVFGIAHWPALTNPYIISDDVRQQIYWMQQWQDPELFPDDLLTRYARSYVPWGVQAIYYAASPFINPVQFSKVLTGILYVLTAAFLFGLGLQFKDERTALLMVCVLFFFTTVMKKISGGMSQSFAFPLVTSYLFFLGRGSLCAAGIVIFLQSLLNPYIFLLCLLTHGIYMTKRFVWDRDWGRRQVPEVVFVRTRTLILRQLPVVAGLVLLVLKYAVFVPEEFGHIATVLDMANKIEYTDQGRYPIVPIPSLLYEMARPWRSFFPFDDLGPVAGWASVAITMAIVGMILIRVNRRVGIRSIRPGSIDLGGFRVFGYVLSASVILYFLSSLLLMRIFLPERYLEFSLTLFYAAAVGVGISVVRNSSGRRNKVFLPVFALFILFAGLRNYHAGIFDYSPYEPLCRFLETTPKQSLMAGHPEVMDNVVTFAKRKAFVTYELSHVWYPRYWETIKEKTFDFFQAYYADEKTDIIEFCRKNKVDYLVVRDEDFLEERLKEGRIYFEPLNAYIRCLTSGRGTYAILDTQRFPPLYQAGGIRVLKCDEATQAGSP